MLNRYTAFAGLLAAASASPLAIRNETQLVNSFKDVPITKEINYIPCFENFTCTNLEVPLDYDDPEAGTTNVAFMKYESPKQPAKGDILYNPGGPGGSPVGNFLSPSFLANLAYLLGDQFNIVAMDPRGVNNSGPVLDCFNGDHATRDVYDYTYTDADPRNEASLLKYYRNSGGFGEWCSRALGDKAKYANTPAVALDMLHYHELLAESNGRPKEEAKVDYYGVSYGSILGYTASQMYPDRLGKFIIDGNMDVEDYYWGKWTTSIEQADEAVESLFKYCYEAGSKCAFFKDDTSVDAMKQRFEAILEDVTDEPIIVSDPNFVQFPTAITHVDIRGFLLLQVYNMLGFPRVATVLAQLEQRNASLLAAPLKKGIVLPGPVVKEYSTVTPKLIIACNDNMGRGNLSTFEDLKELHEKNRETSKYLGDPWGNVIIPQCRKLRFVPPESQQFHEIKKVKTSTPILFVNNQIDPVTSATEKMAGFYEGSAIMYQNATGHGVTLATSKCLAEYVAKYLDTAELPPADTVCEPDQKPFDEVEAEKRSIVPRGEFFGI